MTRSSLASLVVSFALCLAVPILVHATGDSGPRLDPTGLDRGLGDDSDDEGLMIGLGGKCLDVLGANPNEGTPVVMFECHGGLNQQWELTPIGGLWQIESLSECLQPGAPGTTGLPEMIIDDCEDPDALWVLGPGFPLSFEVIHAVTGQCLDVFMASTADGTPTVLFPCSGGANQRWRFDSAVPPPPGGCVDGPEQMCLNNERFRVEIDWRTQRGTAGPGKVVPFGSDDSGLFYFFNPDNWEMLIKVLDNCNGPTNRFWVFAAATTNVEFTLRVTDTQTGRTQQYFNPLGRRAPPILDTNAFATCP